MKITKSYEQLVNLGNFENVKVTTKLETEFVAKSGEKVTSDDIKKKAIMIGGLAKEITLTEVENIRKENVKKDEPK